MVYLKGRPIVTQATTEVPASSVAHIKAPLHAPYRTSISQSVSKFHQTNDLGKGKLPLKLSSATKLTSVVLHRFSKDDKQSAATRFLEIS